MKKLYISVAVAFLSGLVAGAAGTWLYANKKAQEDFDAKLDSVKKQYKRHYIYKESDSSEPKKDDEQAEQEKVQETESYATIASNYSTPIDYTSYAQVDEPVTEGSAPEEEVPDILNDDPTKPRVISEDDYYYEEEMTKLEICLFETEDGDPVLTDEIFDPLDEPYKVITKEDLAGFIAQDETDEIFTVCDSRQCMYSISKQGVSWEDFLRTHPVILDTRY